MILVTAGSGHQGRLLIPKLAAAGFRIRTTTSSPARRKELEALGAHEVVVGDMRDADVYNKAVDGVRAIYHIGPAGLKGEKELGFTMVEAAARSRVEHVVLSSVYFTEIDIIQHLYKRDIEVALIESGVPFTILKPCDFMMPEIFIDAVLALGAFPVFTPQRIPKRHSLIAIDDLTDVALKVLREGAKHYYARYELAGPDKLDYHQITRILSKAMRKEIKFVEKPMLELCTMFWGTTELDEEAQHAFDIIVSAEKWYGRYEFVGNPNTLEWLLGRPPTTFEAFVGDALAKRSGSA
jgi:NAD(P)H dehydrogenase (quinone)